MTGLRVMLLILALATSPLAQGVSSSHAAMAMGLHTLPVVSSLHHVFTSFGNFQFDHRQAPVTSQRQQIDGPYAESKELLGGFAMLQYPSREAAIDGAKRFLEVAGDGECVTYQLMDDNGRLRSFMKADIRDYTISTTSPMPSFKSTLSGEEIADVVAYLQSLK